MEYSVLMAVYKNDNAGFFKRAADSILCQTARSDDIVLVCDGPVYGDLKEAVDEYADRFNIIRLESNIGLGAALDEGLKYCRHDLVARMDSDDVALENRCESQLALFSDNPGLGIVSSAVNEFSGDESNIFAVKELPETHREILSYSKRRNPFNHPAVMFRKSVVQKVGGYTEEFHYFEDYDLWIRMLRSGVKAANCGEPLLNMRISDDTYMRRGGANYAKNLLRFHGMLLKTRYIGLGTFLFCAVPHAMVCVLPNSVRKLIYGSLLRRKAKD